MAEDATLDGFSRLTVVRHLARRGDPAGPELLRRFAEAPELDAEIRAEAAEELRAHVPAVESRERRALPQRPTESR
ncbi:hypothetical protein SGLAM104S_05559 [Streptomyces glaucescens]